jgi:hypothetical protein
MGVASISETSVNFYQTTRRNNLKTGTFVLAAERTWNLTVIYTYFFQPTGRGYVLAI